MNDEAASEGIAFRVRGRVQGVYCRVFGRGVAEELGLQGWIRNESDGSVSGAAFGSPDRLEAFLDRLRVGPPAGRVDALDFEPLEDVEPPAGFEIRY